jgi:hypothetical protein
MPVEKLKGSDAVLETYYSFLDSSLVHIHLFLWRDLLN